MNSIKTRPVRRQPAQSARARVSSTWKPRPRQKLRQNSRPNARFSRPTGMVSCSGRPSDSAALEEVFPPPRAPGARPRGSTPSETMSCKCAVLMRWVFWTGKWQRRTVFYWCSFSRKIGYTYSCLVTFVCCIKCLCVLENYWFMYEYTR